MPDPLLPPLFFPPYAILVFIIGAGTLAASVYIARRAPSDRVQALARFLNQSSVWLLLVGFVGALVAVGPTVAEFYLPLAFNSSWAALFAGALGVGLFIIRKKLLAWYAALEIVGAAATLIVCAASSYGSSSQRAAALLGGVYFLIRGLDNADRAELAAKLRKNLQIRVPRTAVVAVMFFLTALFAPTFMEELNGDRLAPPYLAGAYGQRVPVSALKCGQAFVVCDRAAWQERERLLGTQADRAGAGRRANAEAIPFTSAPAAP